MPAMALNNRNKLDEYHLKILRELLTHPANKYCFDCHQRGPTYVNVTIGSYVCTTCSGMLRGLTPPHRVKSITMATFTPEEIELIKSRGNQYCKNIWLGLYDSEISTTSDEQQKIRDFNFMIAKYEKKRYYVDPASANTHCALNVANGSRTPSSISSSSSSSHNSPSSQHLSDSSSKVQSTCPLRSQPPAAIANVTSNGNSQLFTSNFESTVSSTMAPTLPLADPFGSSSMDPSSGSETSFANFDNNPAFDAHKLAPGNDFLNSSNAYAGFGLTLGHSGCAYHKPSLKTLPLVFSRWSIATENMSKFNKNTNELNVPSEDKYAALKDLDCQMKSQLFEKQQEELKQKQSTTSNGVNWSSLFSNNQSVSSEPSTPFNPFANETNAWNPTTNGLVNPFSSNNNNNIKDSWNGNLSWQNGKNAFPNTSTMTPNGWKTTEEANPFKFQMGMCTQANGQHLSSNPFL